MPPRNLVVLQHRLIVCARSKRQTSVFKRVRLAGWSGWSRDLLSGEMEDLQRRLVHAYKPVLAAAYSRIAAGVAVPEEGMAWVSKVWGIHLRRLAHLDDSREFATVLFAVVKEEAGEDRRGAVEIVKMKFVLFPLVTAIPDSRARAGLLQLVYGQQGESIPPKHKRRDLIEVGCSHLLGTLREHSEQISSYTDGLITKASLTNLDCEQIKEWLFA